MSDLVRAHGGIADEKHTIVASKAVDDRLCRDPLGPAAVVFPDALVGTVVEIEVLQMTKLASGCAKQLLHLADMIVHRASDVEEHQELYRVAPLWPGSHVE